MQEKGFDLIGLLMAGRLATWPLLVGSILGFAVVIDRLWALRGTERAVARTGEILTREVAEGREPGDPAGRAGGAAGIVLPAVARAAARGRSAEDVGRLADARVFEALEGLRTRLWILATIASIAPFVGLFGTVIGIMKSFASIAASGAGGFPVVAAGISEALVATALGLGVAVLALAFYNYFESRLERIEAVLRIRAADLIEAAAATRGA